jgi:hypothetical protein
MSKKLYGKFEILTDERWESIRKEERELAYGYSSSIFGGYFNGCCFHSYGSVNDGYDRVWYGTAKAGDIIVSMETSFISRYKGEKVPKFSHVIVPYSTKKIREDDSTFSCNMSWCSVWRKEELIDKKRNALASCSYICTDCVKENGGKGVKGHCYTSHTDICPVCGKEKSLGCVSDFDWPKGSEVQQLGREV